LCGVAPLQPKCEGRCPLARDQLKWYWSVPGSKCRRRQSRVIACEADTRIWRGGACEALTADGFVWVASETVVAMRTWAKTGAIPRDVAR
jgi:hypothetical protein